MRFLLALSFLFTSGCALNYLSPSEILQVSTVLNDALDGSESTPGTYDAPPEADDAKEEEPAPDAGAGDAAIPPT